MPTTTYLDRFLEPMTEALTPEVARVIINLRADEETEAEVERLREKANEGKLTVEEEAKYKDFIEAVDVISITGTEFSGLESFLASDTTQRRSLDIHQGSGAESAFEFPESNPSSSPGCLWASSNASLSSSDSKPSIMAFTSRSKRRGVANERLSNTASSLSTFDSKNSSIA